jgi:hypothetical protein
MFAHRRGRARFAHDAPFFRISPIAIAGLTLQGTGDGMRSIRVNAIRLKV